MNPCFFIFGFGYTAQALAHKLIAQGFHVIGTSRSPEKQKQNHLNLKLIDFDLVEIERHLNLATHLLISIPPAKAFGDPVLNHCADLIKNQAPYLQWIGYLSSTGVYGNHEGKWVDEESECIPHTPTGITRWQAEKDWLSLARQHQLPLHVFRLSGIYGPGRNALERLMQGQTQSIFKENQVFSRIHVDDIVSTLLASMKQPHPLAIYNVSDDEPASAHDVMLYAAKLLHKEPPLLIPFAKAQLSPMEKEFYANSRRVANLKIKTQLHVILQYKNYKEGLNQIWQDDFSLR